MKAYCVTWRTRTMPAPAFWYFHGEGAAREAYARFFPGEATPPRATEVLEGTPLMDAREYEVAANLEPEHDEGGEA